MRKESYVLLTLADFLAGLLRGCTLMGLALAVGGVAWGLGVLRAPAAEGQVQARRRCLTLIAAGSVALAASQVLLLLLGAYVLAMTLGRNPLPKLFTTTYFAAGVIRTLVALALGATAVRPRTAPVANGWAVIGVLAGAIMLGGTWLTHAVGRLESRAELMALTVTINSARPSGSAVSSSSARCGGWRGVTPCSTPPGRS
jgi:copper resistance protein D